MCTEREINWIRLVNKNIIEKNLYKVGRVCYRLLQNLVKKKLKQKKKKEKYNRGRYEQFRLGKIG